jgi:hypothetical protein
VVAAVAFTGTAVADDSAAGRSFAAAGLRGTFDAAPDPKPLLPSSDPAHDEIVVVGADLLRAVAPPAAPLTVLTASPEKKQALPPSPPAPRPTSGHGSIVPAGTVSAPVAEPSWPRTLTEVRRLKEAPRPTAWSKAEVDEARQACVSLLKGLDVVALPVEPFRDGDCGAPAAVQLVSLGKSPEVTFAPPPVLTCDMVAALGKWLSEIQPGARRHLGSPLIRVEVMSSYSCRNAYGLRNARLSEHGRANALDISSFMTSVGYETAVLDHWGPTQRAVARAEPAKAPSVVRLPPPPPPVAGTRTDVARAANPLPTTVATAPAPLPPPGLASGLRSLSGTPLASPNGTAFAPPSQLGGPQPPRGRRSLIEADAPSDAKARFLREIHVSACRIFGTVLGPEANRAHENHFHVDMAERKTGAFCE